MKRLVTVLFLFCSILSCYAVDPAKLTKAKNGDAKAQYDVAWDYLRLKDKANTLYWFEKSAEQGYEEALDKIIGLYDGSLYVSEVDDCANYEKTFYWALKAYKLGLCDRSAYVIACCYRWGRGVEKNIFNEIYYFKKGSEKYSLCNDRLGEIYENGKDGVEKDLDQAAYWYSKNLNDSYSGAKALENLNRVNKLRGKTTVELCLSESEINKIIKQGIEYYNVKDYKNALIMFNKAANNYSGAAQYNLGNMYMNGLGVVKNMETAVKWYRKAAEQGSADAQCNLGTFYYLGKGVSLDYTKAVYWFKIAAKDGHVNAQYNLGSCYFRGNGIQQSYTEAVKWYTMAAEQGLAAAQYELALCYISDKDNQDLEKAKYWMQKAYEQNYEGSEVKLKIIESLIQINSKINSKK